MNTDYRTSANDAQKIAKFKRGIGERGEAPQTIKSDPAAPAPKYPRAIRQSRGGITRIIRP